MVIIQQETKMQTVIFQELKAEKKEVEEIMSFKESNRDLDRELSVIFDNNVEVVSFEVEKELCDQPSRGKMVQEMSKEFENTNLPSPKFVEINSYMSTSEMKHSQVMSFTEEAKNFQLEKELNTTNIVAENVKEGKIQNPDKSRNFECKIENQGTSTLVCPAEPFIKKNDNKVSTIHTSEHLLNKKELISVNEDIELLGENILIPCKE